MIRPHIATRVRTLCIAAFTPGTMMLATTWADPTEDAIMARVSAFHAAATEGDIDAIIDLVAEDDEAVAIGTDPTEVFQGHDDIVDWWRALFAFLEELGADGLVTQITNTIQVDYRDVVGWVAQEGTWTLPDPIGEVDFRVTLVLEKRMGDWDIVQQHFSIGFPNEQLPPDF